jgi:hypothetical protein
VRTPVDNMSIRALIGMVQALLTPGKDMARSISAISSSGLRWSGQPRRRIPLSQPGAHEEYQRSTGRHWDSGLSSTVVSIIEKGAGSVAVSARPALPKTRSTSGKPFST